MDMSKLYFRFLFFFGCFFIRKNSVHSVHVRELLGVTYRKSALKS